MNDIPNITYRSVNADDARSFSATKNALGLCVALYDYYPSEPSQLQIKVDDAIILLSKNHDYAGWWKGSLGGKV